MEAIEQYLLQVVYFFTGNWIALGILAVVVVIMAVKKPKVLFKIVGLIVLAVAVLYIMMFLEKALFSGHSSKGRSYDVERKAQ